MPRQVAATAAALIKSGGAGSARCRRLRHLLTCPRSVPLRVRAVLESLGKKRGREDERTGRQRFHPALQED